VTAAISTDAPVLITGGAGFIGCNLADKLAREGCRVRILDDLSRAGVEANLDWLRQRHGSTIAFVRGDVRDAGAVHKAVAGARAVFHLAAQVAVTCSLSDPLQDFAVNAQGTLHVLEAARAQPQAPAVLFASTNKVYGALSDIPMRDDGGGWRPCSAELADAGVAESRPLAFASPYGCSKGCADQYVLDYASSFAMPAAVLRLSCVYGPRQMGGADQGWVAHFAHSALRGSDVEICGDGQQTRDLLHVADAVAAFAAAWRHIARVQGLALNIGGGPEQMVSVERLLAYLEMETGRTLRRTYAPTRMGDQRWYASDWRRAARLLEWSPSISWRDGVRDLLAWAGLRQGAEAVACA